MSLAAVKEASFLIKTFFIVALLAVYIVVEQHISENLIPSRSAIQNFNDPLGSQEYFLSMRKPNYMARNNTKNTIYISALSQLFSYMQEHRWPLIISMSTGRLGNNLHNFALSLVLQQKYPNATYFISETLHSYVKTLIDEDYLVFPVISDEVMFTIPANMSYAFQPRNDYADVSSYVYSSMVLVMGKKKVLLLEAYPLDVFEGFEHFLQDNLKLRGDLIYKANEFLNATRAKFTNESNATFVGVHIRRKDYIQFIGRLGYPPLPGKRYFETTFQYYKTALKNPIFVICTDDPLYAMKAFQEREDVVISFNRTPAEDFAILSSCSHSIMTIGSFGFWGTFLSGGQVLYAWLKGARVMPFLDPVKIGNAFLQFIEVNSKGL